MSKTCLRCGRKDGYFVASLCYSCHSQARDRKLMNDKLLKVLEDPTPKKKK